MPLRERLRRFTSPVSALDDERLRNFCSSRSGVTPIVDVQAREQAAVVGEISTLRIVPRPGGSPWLEATVTDGTGSMVVRWTGRRRIAGIKPGARLVLRGRCATTGPGGRLLVTNPDYELL